MKKPILLVFVLVFLSAAVVAGFVRPVEASGTILITADGSVVPDTAPISTVDNITYVFTDNINDSIVVERDNIVVDGAGYTLQGTGAWDSKGIDLSGRSNVTIKNVEVRAFYNGILLTSSSNCSISGNNIAASEGSGILLWESSNNTLTGNDIANNGADGIYANDSSNNTVSGNNVTANNEDGIRLVGSSNNTVSGNNVTANNEVGIELSGSSNSTISGNNLENNDWGIWLYFPASNNALRSNSMVNNSYNFGIYSPSLSDYFMQNIDVSNTVDGKPVYYWINRQDVTVPLDAGYVALINCSNVIVQNLNLTKNGQGILLEHTEGSTITENNITNNRDGIWLAHSSNNNTISGNNITNSDWRGIYLAGSSNNGITGNYITANAHGIELYYSSNYNSIIGNNITANTYDGMGLNEASNNSIYENNVINNAYGIELGDSSNNTFCHNNFIDNSQQVYDYSWDIPDWSVSVNVWDDGYPSGGNYWSNYAGVDLYSGQYQDETSSDGIGDTSHMIDANNTDGYPLMGPISFFDAGTWDEVTYYVDTVSNSTISDFSFNPDDCLISFNVTGADDTVGFCRVTIPRQLLWCDVLEEWNVMVNGNPPTYLKAMEDVDNTYLYFNYSHSIQNVQIEGIHIIPEFPTWTSMLLITIVLTVAIATHKRRLFKTPIH